MKTKTVDDICAAMDARGTEYDRHDDYSGRGMYGKTTAGVVCGSFAEFAAAVALAAGGIVNDPDRPGSELDDFVDDIRRVRTDDMGRDTIFY